MIIDNKIVNVYKIIKLFLFYFLHILCQLYNHSNVNVYKKYTFFFLSIILHSDVRSPCDNAYPSIPDL